MNTQFTPLLASSLLACFALACAGGLPAVVSSNPQRVSIEFELTGTVVEAGKLAAEECEKHGKLSDFEMVDATATQKSRIANFRCINPGVAAPPAEGAGEAATD